MSDSHIALLGNKLSQYLSEHGQLNITVLPHPSSYIPGLVIQSILAEKNIESQLEVGIASPMLRDNRPHLLIGYDRSKPDGLSITLKLRGETSTIKPGLPLPLVVSMMLETISILGEVARSMLTSSSIAGSALYKESTALELFNAKTGYGVEITEKFLAFYATGDYTLSDSLFSTSIPFLPSLTGGKVNDIEEFLEKIGIKPDTLLLKISANEGKTLVEEVLKKINSYAKRIVASNTLVSFLPQFQVEKTKIDLRELASALLILSEVSPGSILDGLSRNTLRPVLSDYYRAIKTASDFILDLVEDKKLIFKTNVVIAENSGFSHEIVPIRYVSMVLEFLGFIDKNHVFALETDGLPITSKQEVWVKQSAAKGLKTTSIEHMYLLLSV